MAFGNIFFLFIFLPMSLLLYYLVPRKLVDFRNLILVLLSLLFYSWGRPEYLILLMFSIVFNFASALEIAHFRDADNPGWARNTMIIAVVVNLLMLGFYKYYGFLISTINGITGMKIKYSQLPLPLGISFYTFTILSYIFDVYYGKTDVQKNFIRYTLYVSFFPKLVSGPIVAYREMEEQLIARKVSKAKFGAGMNLFLVGLAKKVLIADNLGVPYAAIAAMESRSLVTAWLGMIFYSLQLYFDFSGYSDMAIGIAQMFGFEFAKNFDYPYLSSSVSEFWRRWHISLGAWFRNYVYIPMGGNRCSQLMQLRNLATVWLLTGLWHGASWTFIIWGIWHGAFVILEKFVWGDFLKKLPKAVSTGLTVLIAFLGWVWFFSPSVGYAVTYFGQLFGAGAGFIDSTALYYLATNFILLVIAVLGCGPLPQKLHAQYVYRSKNSGLLMVSAIGTIVMFLLCVAYLINNTYSSFLYFQF